MLQVLITLALLHFSGKSCSLITLDTSYLSESDILCALDPTKDVFNSVYQY